MYMYMHVGTHMCDELSIRVDVSIVPTNHAESHGVVRSLGDLVHQSEGLLQDGGLQLSLLGRLVEVRKKELIFGDSLDRFDEE